MKKSRIIKDRIYDGQIYDLDDPSTYSHLPSRPKELDDRMFREIGITLCYMNIWHSDTWGHPKKDGGQKQRVMKLIRYFCKERINHYDDVLWLQEQVFVFQEETENMC